MSKRICILRICSFLLCFFIAASLHAMPSGSLQAGPENHGLRMQLSITTASESGKDAYTVRLDLMNTGQVPVVLVANWPYEQDKGDYAEFLKSEVMLISHPEVLAETAQTGGEWRISPQPEYEIKPGARLTVEWSSTDRRLKPKNYPNTSPYFPTDGLYGIRAKFLAVTKDGKRILLTSNEQPVPVGGSVEMPKYATARIIRVDPEKKTAAINLGSDQRIEKNDKFSLRYGTLGCWHLTITEVDEGLARGTVETIKREGEDVPLFPKKDWIASLMRPEHTRGDI